MYDMYYTCTVLLNDAVQLIFRCSYVAVFSQLASYQLAFSGILLATVWQEIWTKGKFDEFTIFNSPLKFGQKENLTNSQFSIHLWKFDEFTIHLLSFKSEAIKF